MLDHVEVIFNNMPEMLKRLKKASYAERMEKFRDEHGHFFREMTDAVELAENAGTITNDLLSRLSTRIEGRYFV